MRKAKPKKRVILPDPVFNDTKVSKFVNHLMYDGKKTKSYEIFYNALETVKAKMQNEEKPALDIWKQAGYLEAGSGQHHPAGGGEEPPYRWCYLPGAYGDPSRP